MDKFDTDHHYLTEREREIFRYRMQGMSYREIADRLHISVHTVRKHFNNISSKIDTDLRKFTMLTTLKYTSNSQ